MPEFDIELPVILETDVTVESQAVTLEVFPETVKAIDLAVMGPAVTTPPITIGPTAPSSPAVNDVWIDTT